MNGRPGNERNIRPKQVPDNRQRSSTAQTGLLHSESTDPATVSCAAPHFHKTLTLRFIQNTPDLLTPLQQPEKITQHTKVANYLKYAKTHRSSAYCCRREGKRTLYDYPQTYPPIKFNLTKIHSGVRGGFLLRLRGIIADSHILCQRHAPATPHLTIMNTGHCYPKHPRHAPHWHGAVVIAAGAAEIIITFAH